MDSKYLEYEFIERKPRTEVYDVISKTDGGSLGIVKWYPPWRHYCFFIGDKVWSDRCLADLSNFVKYLNEEHKKREALKC